MIEGMEGDREMDGAWQRGGWGGGGYLPIQNVSLMAYFIDNQLIKVIVGCGEQQQSNKNVKKQREKSPLPLLVLQRS